MVARAEAEVVEAVVALEQSGSAEEYYAGLQRLINKGGAWHEEAVARAMTAAIAQGYCCLGRQGCSDLFGTYIPSRFEVNPGTRGSLDFVRSRKGVRWAAMVEEVG